MRVWFLFLPMTLLFPSSSFLHFLLTPSQPGIQNYSFRRSPELSVSTYQLIEENESELLWILL